MKHIFAELKCLPSLIYIYFFDQDFTPIYKKKIFNLFLYFQALKILEK